MINEFVGGSDEFPNPYIFTFDKPDVFIVARAVKSVVLKPSCYMFKCPVSLKTTPN